MNKEELTLKKLEKEARNVISKEYRTKEKTTKTLDNYLKKWDVSHQNSELQGHSYISLILDGDKIKDNNSKHSHKVSESKIT